MTKKITAKFLKTDDYKNSIFLVSNDATDLKPSYTKMKKYFKILSKKYDTNLPIYIKNESSKKFATIRFKKTSKLTKLKDYGIYEINFDIFENEHNNKKYCNLIVESIKLIKEANNGSKIVIDDDIEISDSDDENNELDEL